MRLEGGYVKGPFFTLTNLVGPKRVDTKLRLEEGGGVVPLGVGRMGSGRGVVYIGRVTQ